jgi:hypothetical protein
LVRQVAQPWHKRVAQHAAFAQRLKSSRELFFHRDLDAPVLRASFRIIIAVRILVRRDRLFLADDRREGLVADWDLDEGALDLAPATVELAVVVLVVAAVH